MNVDYDKLLKCIFIGDTFVGKSSFCNKLVGREFPLTYQSTIGVDFFVKTFNLNNENIKLQIWDTTGQEKYRSITMSFYRNIGFIFLMFDLTNLKSFMNIKKWLADVDTFCNLDSKKVLIGNKSDLKCDIDEDEIFNFCIDNNLNYYSTSVKNNNIEKLVIKILKENLEVNQFNNMIIDDSVINVSKYNKKKCCNII